VAKKRIDPKLPIVPIGNESVWSRITKGLGSVAVDGLWSWLMRPDSFGDRLLRRLNELFREMDDGTIAIFDEETYIGQATGLNFTGAGVTAAQAANLPVGNYDITIPGGGGGGGETPFIEAEADEDIAAGQFVAVFDDAGTPKCRVAKSSSGQGYQADGWCEDAFASGATATIFLPGTVNAAGGTGLTAGDVWLGTDGYATNTAPTTAGYISQQIGVAEDGTSVAFEPQPDILLADPHSGTTGGSSTSVTTTTSTTVVVATGVTALLVTMIGGGGGGKSSGAASSTGGGGGGSGEYCIDFPMPVTPGETLTLTIGAGGAGGTAGGSGSDGGTTSVAGLAGTFAVLGGLGATSGTGARGGGPRGGAGGTFANPPTAGAMGTAESPVHFGGGGGGGGVNAAANSTAGTGAGAPGFLTGGAAGVGSGSGGSGGGGAATIWGNGGAGGAANGAGVSAAAASYGAGGGGAGGNSGSAQAGGDGAGGYILLAYVA
jgi:hypothetical protein